MARVGAAFGASAAVAALLVAASLASAWSDSFPNGVDTARWSFPRNGTCWAMPPGVTFLNGAMIAARRPGITINLMPGGPCGAGSATSSQIAAPCTGNGVYEIVARPPHGAPRGALAFFSAFREQRGLLLQLLFGWDVAFPRDFTVSLNGRTARNATFFHAWKCSYPTAADAKLARKHTIHWSGSRVAWYFDGRLVQSVVEPLVLEAAPCVAPYVILRGDGQPLPARTVLDVNEVAVREDAASIMHHRADDAFKCVPMK